MVYHDIMRFHIAMHDSLAMTKVQRLEELIDIEAHIIVGEARVQGSKVGVVDVFKDQTGRLALTIANDVQQSHDIGTIGQILQDLDLTLDLLLLDRLEDLDDAFLVVDDVDAFEHLGVFPPSCVVSIDLSSPDELTYLAHNLVVFQDPPRHIHAVIVPVGPRHSLVDICIDARHGAGGSIAGWTRPTMDGGVGTRRGGGREVGRRGQRAARPEHTSSRRSANRQAEEKKETGNNEIWGRVEVRETDVEDTRSRGTGHVGALGQTLMRI